MTLCGDEFPNVEVSYIMDVDWDLEVDLDAEEERCAEDALLRFLQGG